MIKIFNKNRLLQSETGIVFYKENEFSNVLEYYIERELLKAISNCKEEKLKLKKDKLKQVTEMREQRKKEVQKEHK